MGERESKEWKTWRKMSTVLYAYVVKKKTCGDSHHASLVASYESS